MTWWRQLWHDHGTKLLGALQALLGLLEFVDQRTVDLIGQAFGPQWGPVVSRGIQITSGMLVARRGFQNSRRGP